MSLGAGRNTEADMENRLFLCLQREQKLGKEPVPVLHGGQSHAPQELLQLPWCWRAQPGLQMRVKTVSNASATLPWEQWVELGPVLPSLLLQLPWGPCFPSPSLLPPKSPADLSWLDFSRRGKR